MKPTCLSACLGMLTIVLAGTASAGDVSVKDVHLCCGSCVTAAVEALEGVEGVTKPTADRNSKIVTFQAKDSKAAQAGVNALAAAGFAGKATHGDEKIALPDSGAKAGEKANEITFTGVHLCCGACVTGAKEAITEIPNASSFDVDRNTGTITVRGSDIVVTKAVEILNNAGFYGKIKK